TCSNCGRMSFMAFPPAKFEVQSPFQFGSGSASFVWMSVADFVRADRPSGALSIAQIAGETGLSTASGVTLRVLRLRWLLGGCDMRVAVCLTAPPLPLFALSLICLLPTPGLSGRAISKVGLKPQTLRR